MHLHQCFLLLILGVSVGGGQQQAAQEDLRGELEAAQQRAARLAGELEEAKAAARKLEAALGELNGEDFEVPPSRLIGKVVGLTDGDTISVLVEESPIRVRLEGIDAPERGQDFSQSSRRHLSSRVYEKVVTVELRGFDRYNRILGRVFVDGQDINLAMVAAGLAWHFNKYSSEEALAEAEARARSQSVGIWSRPDAIAPWDWREGQRTATDPSLASSPSVGVSGRSRSTTTDFSCGSKRFCSEMISCAEARFYLNTCGLTRLDGDKDGIPCEPLC